MTTMNNEDPADPSVHEPRIADAELPEPVLQIRRNAAGQVYLWAPTLNGSFDSLQYVGESFYTADQMREAIAAERERSHELLQAADHIRAGLEAELAALRASAASVQADQRAEIDAANAVIDELLAVYTYKGLMLPARQRRRLAAIDAARALRKGTP